MRVSAGALVTSPTNPGAPTHDRVDAPEVDNQKTDR